MVGGLLELARLAVDRAGADPRRERCVQQDVVDPQAGIAAKAEHPVVPPAELLRRLLEQPERIDQAELDQPEESRALFGRAVDLARPLLGVVDVAVFGRDVEVAEQRERGRRGAGRFALGRGVCAGKAR